MIINDYDTAVRWLEDQRADSSNDELKTNIDDLLEFMAEEHKLAAKAEEADEMSEALDKIEDIAREARR